MGSGMKIPTENAFRFEMAAMTRPRFPGWVWKVCFFASCAAAAMSVSFAAEHHDFESIRQTEIQKLDGVPTSPLVDSVRSAWTDERSDATAFSEALKNAGARARAGDWLGAAEILESFPGDSYYKRKLFSDLAFVWMLLEVPPQLPDKPEFPQPSTALPCAPTGYPQDLREAAEFYLQVVTPFQLLTEARKPDQTSTDYQTHKVDYWNLTAQLLAKKDGPFADKFLAYRWGGWCGTGSDQFRDPQSIALLMALVADKRWAEAAGAALSVAPREDIGGALRVLSACVPDAKKVVIGGLSVIDLGPKEYRIEARRATLLALLLCLPGDRRVGMMTRLAALAPPEALPVYFRALGKFVQRRPPPSDKNGVSRGWGWGTSSDNFNAISAESAGEGAQKDALNFLCSQASPKLPVGAAATLARIFHEKCRPESIPALHCLLDHPSMSVAKEAAEALEYLGQKVEIPAKLGPVRYSIRVNGTPYANNKVSWTVKRGSISTGSEVTADSTGVVEVPRDYFLDQAAEPVQSVALRTVSMASPADPWFGVLLPAPPASDDIIPVELKTASLRVELPLPRPKEELQTTEVVLWGLQDAETQKIGFWSFARFQIPVSELLDFKMLTPGVYRAEIRISGATSWTGELRAGEAPAFTVPLQRASDVKFPLVPPKGWHINAFKPELWQDGNRISADWDYDKHIFHGVPEGRYVLHIPSSEEVRKLVRGLLPDGPDFPGTDVPFDIGKNSPAEINLGEIRVKAADAGKRLLPGDYMTITFSNKNDPLDGCYSVSSDGFVNMPFIGKVKAEGLSASDLTATLEREYDQQEIYKGLRIRVERMDKPPDLTPYLQDLEKLKDPSYLDKERERIKEIEASPFWKKQGDFFTPKDRNPSHVLP